MSTALYTDRAPADEYRQSQGYEDQPSHAEEEKGRLLDATFSKDYSHASNLRASKLPWIVASVTTLLLVVSLIFNVLQWRTAGRWIFPTDLPDSRKVIEYEQRTFTGALVYDPDQQKMLRHMDAEVEYFGEPSQELDDAWSDMMRGEFPPMTDEEAAPYLPELRRFPTDGHYHFEPDMFHSLHCLNEIRTRMAKVLYPNATYEGHIHDWKYEDLDPRWDDTAHMEHCMDRIRQAIVCFGDMTPSPMYFWDGFNIMLGRPGAHTCRKWQPIRDWMDERGRAVEG